MNLEDAVRKRFSARAYKDEKVDREKLAYCLELVRHSPSARNGQPYKFIVCDEENLVKQIAEATQTPGVPINRYTRNVPCFIAIAGEKAGLKKALATQAHFHYDAYDIGIAVQTFCLAATDAGLDTCIIGWFGRNNLAKLLDLPKNKEIRLLIAVGEGGAEYKARKKKSTEELVSYNKY